MTLKQLDTLDSIRKFLEGNQRVAFSVLGSKPERYQFIRKTLVDFVYCKASKPDKGLLRQYLSKITGYSPAQLSRLILKHKDTGVVDCGGRRVKSWRKEGQVLQCANLTPLKLKW